MTAGGLPGGGVIASALAAIATVGSDFLSSIKNFFDISGFGIVQARYMLYAVRIPFIYFEYFVHDAVSDTSIGIIGNLLYFFVEVGGFTRWLDYLNLIDLSSVSAAFGQCSFLNSFGVCPIDAALGMVAGIASFFYSIEYIRRLCQDPLSKQEVVANCLGLVASTIHIIAVIIFFSSGGVLLPVTVGVTLLSSAIYVVYWALCRYPLKCLA